MGGSDSLLRLLDANNLQRPLWTCDRVESWSYPPAGFDMELKHHVVLLADIDWDGTPEILDLEIAWKTLCDPEHEDACMKAMVLSSPQLACTVFHFNHDQRQFQRKSEFLVRPEPADKSPRSNAGQRQSQPQILRALDLTPKHQIVNFFGSSMPEDKRRHLTNDRYDGFWIDGIGEVWDASKVHQGKGAEWEITHRFDAARDNKSIWSFTDRYSDEPHKHPSLRHVVLFADLDWDGIQEIVDVQARITEIPFGWKPACGILHYDAAKRRYVTQYEVRPGQSAPSRDGADSPDMPAVRLLWPQPDH